MKMTAAILNILCFLVALNGFTANTEPCALALNEDINVERTSDGSFVITANDGRSAMLSPFDMQVQMLTMDVTEGASEREGTSYAPQTSEIRLKEVHDVIRVKNDFLLATNIGVIKVPARKESANSFLNAASRFFSEPYKTVAIVWEFELIPRPPNSSFYQSRYWSRDYKGQILEAKKIRLVDNKTLHVDFQNRYGLVTVALPLGRASVIISPFKRRAFNSEDSVFKQFLRNHLYDQKSFEDYYVPDLSPQ